MEQEPQSRRMIGKVIGGAGGAETARMLRLLKATTLTDLGEALGQETSDNCPQQQVLRRILRDFVRVGLLTKLYGEQNLYIWHDDVYQRYVDGRCA